MSSGGSKSGNELSEKIRDEILACALKNAIEHDGKAMLGPVMSILLGRHPELKPKARELVKVVKEVIEEVNRLSKEDQVKLIKERFPDILESKREEKERRELPPLPNVSKYAEVRTRFAPNPDFLIHLGNARPAILSHMYARMYKGKMILRFEDTDPKTKPPMPEAYRLIKEDLKWLGVQWDEEYIQSLRLEIYYEIARELIKRGGAYVDLCKREEFQAYKLKGVPCPHRKQSVERNLELFDKMLEGAFSEGEAVLRVKTDLKHPDPSVRDWVAFRIIDTDRNPHPIVGSKYVVWPTYNFAAAVDDHLLGITHILRGKEHAVNTVKQKYLYAHMGWEYPEVINLGRLKLEGLILSKSKIKELIKNNPGKFSGPDDVRFGTIASLRNRGIVAEAIREVIMEVGVKPTDAKISWDNIAATNRKIIDRVTKRIMFVTEPVKLTIKNYGGEPKVTLPYHPENKELGSRSISLKIEDSQLNVFISKSDADELRKEGMIRLMGLCNIRYLSSEGNTIISEYSSSSLEDARKLNLSIIQWVPTDNFAEVKVLMPEELELRRITGLSEPAIAEASRGERLQFIRFGFVKVEKVKKLRDGKARVETIYMHQ